MRRIKLGVLAFLLFWSGVSFAQTAADANLYFESGEYQLASEAYRNLLRTRSKDAALYNYRLAYSAYMLNENETAIEHFEKSAAKYPISNFYLGEIYFEKYLFQDAADAYADYIFKPDASDSLLYKVEKKQKQAELGARFLNRVEDVAIIDSTVVDKTDFIKKMKFTRELGTLSQNNEFDGLKNIALSVFTTQRGDRQYFADMENGNIDLFTKYKLLENWTEAEPLADLNSEANENFPFLMLDGVTLYFASDGEESMGGYDIFITRLNTSDNRFLKPENIGMPFNSPFNDYMMVIDELNKVGWFASDRYLPEGKVAIYQFIPNAEKRIIRSENQDSIINKAQIKEFTILDDAVKLSLQKTESKNTSSVNKIFINDKISYSDASDFKSNEARNHFYQIEKLNEELKASTIELETLRESFANARNEENRRNIGSKIFTLEARLREIKPQIDKLTVKMRNEEIKSIP